MKKLAICCTIIALGLSSAPAHAQSDTPCKSKNRMLKLRCLRSLRQKSQGNIKEYRNKNSDVLKERKLLRRGDRPTGAKRGSDGLRRERLRALKERRQAKNEEGDKRIHDKRSRLQRIDKKRKKMMRKRLDAVPAKRTMTKEQARSRARRLHGRTQERREAVKALHEKCRDQRGRDRMTCMREARN